MPNCAWLLGELGRRQEAKQALQVAVQSDPGMAAAAYNLCVLEAETSPAGALAWCRKATESQPGEPRYAFSLAFYQHQAGQTDQAIVGLRKLAAENPEYLDGQILLAQLLELVSVRESPGAAALRGSWSVCGCVRSGLSRPPVVWQQLGEPRDRVGADPSQYVLVPGIRIHPCTLARRHEAP